MNDIQKKIMTNEIDKEKSTLSIDRESYDRLTKGTPFQRTTNMLGMLAKMLDEMTDDAIGCMKLTEVEAANFRAKQKEVALKMFMDNPPSGLDQDALKAFCE